MVINSYGQNIIRSGCGTNYSYYLCCLTEPVDIAYSSSFSVFYFTPELLAMLSELK